MKKRIISFLLMVVMLLSVVGCSDGGSETNNSEPQSEVASSKEELSFDENDYINSDDTVKMPDLTNVPVEQAKSLLESLGLKVKVTEEYDTSGKINVGCVIKTDYRPDESIEKGTQIFLTVRKEGTFIDPNVPYVDPLVAERGEVKQGANSDYIPLNYEFMKAVWISQFDLQGVLADGSQRSAESLRQLFGNLCAALAKDGYNTVIVQLRPYGDSFYPSEYYPWSDYAVGAYGLYGSYDPLKVMIEEAHKYKLSFQAWINPMRAYNSAKIFEIINVNYPLRQWYDNPKKYPNYVYRNGTYYYLNVAYEEVRQLIIDGAAEIVRNYDVDGVHLDDYFYPSGISNDVDQAVFSKSGFRDRKLFRKDNVNKLVSGLYSAIKAENKNVLFGISPAGNINNVRNACLLDIDTILANKGYVDYIMPQIYWGFEHSSQPYKTCLANWQALVKEPSIKFIVGLTASNIATPSGEFVNNKDVFARYLLHAQKTDKFDGICIFSVATLYGMFSAKLSANDGVQREMRNFLPLFKSLPNKKILY